MGETDDTLHYDSKSIHWVKSLKKLTEREHMINPSINALLVGFSDICGVRYINWTWHFMIATNECINNDLLSII